MLISIGNTKMIMESRPGIDRCYRRANCPLVKVVQVDRRYSWPGNVRELQHVLQRGSIVSDRGRLKFDHLREPSPAPPPMNTPQSEERILTVAELRDLEVRNILAALQRTSGKICGDDGAAALLGMKPTTLVSRIKALNVETR